MSAHSALTNRLEEVRRRFADFEKAATTLQRELNTQAPYLVEVVGHTYAYALPDAAESRSKSKVVSLTAQRTLDEVHDLRGLLKILKGHVESARVALDDAEAKRAASSGPRLNA